MRDDQGNELVRSRQFFGTLALLAIAVLLPGSAALAGGQSRRGTGCEQTALKMYASCRAEVIEEYLATRANCLNLADEEERSECNGEAAETLREDRRGCGDQREARTDACELLGEDRYDTDPLTDPSLDFVHPDTIGNTNPVNPFVSLEAGHTHVLRAGEGFEEIVVVHVTDDTREILGQPCRVVVDAVLLVEEDPPGVFEYEAVEVTDDFFAQTDDEDVIYCGEVSREFEDGILRSLDGSFEAGVPDDFTAAKAGILIKADPTVGDSHRQEFFLGEAEDLITYVDKTADVPDEEGGDDALDALFRCDANCLKTEEFIPPDPHDGEFKYYRSGIGFVLGVALEDGEPTGERDELICTGDSLAVLETPACGIGDPDGLLETLCKLSPDAFCTD
jgi:hypothetical protein